MLYLPNVKKYRFSCQKSDLINVDKISCTKYLIASLKSLQKLLSFL